MRGVTRNIVPGNMDHFFLFSESHVEYEQMMKNRLKVYRVVMDLCMIPSGRSVASWARDKLAPEAALVMVSRLACSKCLSKL